MTTISSSRHVPSAAHPTINIRRFALTTSCMLRVERALALARNDYAASAKLLSLYFAGLPASWLFVKFLQLLPHWQLQPRPGICLKLFFLLFERYTLLHARSRRVSMTQSRAGVSPLLGLRARILQCLSDAMKAPSLLVARTGFGTDAGRAHSGGPGYCADRTDILC